MKVLRKIVGETKIDRIRSQKSENSAVSNQSMSGLKGGEENGTKMKRGWILRDKLKFQGIIYLPEEDLQDARKEDGTI